ncbi:MAG: dephospho-CoA kinase [Candidatus Tectomicrobia bacterium]|uniref:Dephospho-CoA kinase n=1 Tax=Tectimicrobiota bacterium TaxID=2528274 RepID=A0A933E8H1_UNCTE|nr:dephospho-CoA kinase [Candidatus Tectomicrobia bacterium]MBI2178901.1 dephospho-CoA kinase [Candidatus Tectomicrobia bacterium]MBI4252171.1 dephospho-CoA kinase [Candidatus Tectomicrobia bacterium]
MLRVGLTGGIASGKSAVSRALARRGIPVIDADQIARELAAPGSDALREIVEAFGREVLSPDGSLDRSRLGGLVFSDEAKRRRLEAILHPRIRAEQDRRLQELEEEGVPVAVVDAALMVEAGAWRRFDLLVVVDSREADQIARLMERNGLDEAAARARVRAQMPLSEKVKYADRVVDNRGALEELEGRAEALADWLLERARKNLLWDIDKSGPGA